MIGVHTEPEVESVPGCGWEIVVWAGDAFDYAIPFRRILEEIKDATGDGAARLLLPDHEQDEDFIEGILQYDETSVQLYFEYALGYLSLRSEDRAVLDSLLTKILPLITVSPN